MEKIDVVSSNVVSVGWSNNRLYVDFKRGSYVYKDVPEKVYNELLAAESKGKYMCREVKGKYDYERIG